MFCRKLSVSLLAAISSVSVIAGSPVSAGRLDARASQMEKTTMHSIYGTAETVSGHFIVDGPGTRLDRALAFVAGRPEAFRMAAPSGELRLLFEKTDNLGLTHLRFQQVYNGLKVWGCQTIVHFKDDQTIYLVGGQTIPTPVVSTTPTVSEADAALAAVVALQDQYSPADLQTQSELIVFPNDGDPRLVWLVTVTSPVSGAIHWLVFVDAQTGTLLQKYNDIRFDGPDTGSGPDVQNVNRTFPIYEESGVYKMINTTYNGDITTYEDYNNGGPISTDPDGDKIWDDNEDQKAAVSAHYNADLVYEYFLTTHGRDSYDGLGRDLLVNVHDPSYTNNAYWDGTGIHFGDGDGVIALAFSGSLDVVTHEFTHGVGSYTAGFIYAFQSGALDEHFADAFAAMVDRDDWTCGEDIALIWPGYFRSMEDPTIVGHPAHMDDYQNYDLSNDFGGAHINCGIPSHCLYYVSELIGRDISEQIWYRCLTTYLTPSSGFYFWAGMIFQSSRDLYGTLYDAEVSEALGHVGLSTAYSSSETVAVAGYEGNPGSCTVWIHNPGPGPAEVSAVSPTLPALTVTEVPGNHPSIPAGDSAAFLVEVAGGPVADCDIGMWQDTLRFDIVGAVNVQIKLQVSSTIGYTTTSVQSEGFSTTCLSATSANDGSMSDFGQSGQDALIQGSLLVGLMDGMKPTVYRTFYGFDRFLPVDEFYVADSLVSYRLSSEDGRVLGSVEYTRDVTDPENCGFAIAKYILRNSCDTTLTVHSGLIYDFDVIDGESNHVKYQSSDQMIYMTDVDNTCAVGLAMLGAEARNLRAIYNPVQVDDGAFSDALAYSSLNLASNVGSPMPGDFSALMSFGEGLIGPDDSLVYLVAMLVSPTGSDGLASILEKAHAWALSCCTGVRGNANGDPDDKVNISDVSYLLEFLFGIPTGPEPVCWEEGNANGDIDEKVNVSDVSYLLDYLFGIPTGPGPKPCP